MIALKMMRGKNQGGKKKAVKRHLSGGTGRVTAYTIVFGITNDESGGER